MSLLSSMPQLPESWLPRLKALGEHYAALAVRPGDHLDLVAARAALDALYGMARLRPPRDVVAARGPGEAARTVDGGSPEVQDRVKGTLLTALRPGGPELEHRYLCSRRMDLDGARMPRRLLHLRLPYEPGVTAYVEVTCPSTGHRHHLRVPPDVDTCAQAVAWTFGLEPSAYRPLVEA